MIHTMCLVIASLFIQHVLLLLHYSYITFGYCFIIHSSRLVIASLFIHHVWLLLHYSYNMFDYLIFFNHVICYMLYYTSITCNGHARHSRGDPIHYLYLPFLKQTP